jgi:hypothetical protein
LLTSRTPREINAPMQHLVHYLPRLIELPAEAAGQI